jgi:hypothetical protein
MVEMEKEKEKINESRELGSGETNGGALRAQGITHWNINKSNGSACGISHSHMRDL